MGGALEADLRRVLFIETTHTPVGGVGARQSRLANTLPQRGWEPVFAFTRGARFHDPAAYLKNLPGLTGIELDARTGSSEGRRYAVEAVLQRVRPDVVLPGAVRDAWVVVEQLKTDAGPRIVYGLPGIDLSSLAFIAAHAPFIDAAFGVSPVTTCVLREYCGVDAARVFVVPTGVERAKMQSPPDVQAPLRLLYVGRFDPDKRALDAAALADELAARGVDFEMTLVGSGVHMQDLQSAASRHAGRLRILAPAPRDALYERVYPGADAILLFSPVEGLPNALLEGMAHGLVPISSDFTGRRELGLFRDRETALVFGVGDVRAAADRVCELASTPALKASIGAAARALVESERSAERMADAFAGVLDAAMAFAPMMGVHGPIPLEGRSRLRTLLGPRLAEAVRRALGISFAHRDASEWPLIGNVEPEDRAREEERLRSAIERCESPGR